MNLTRLRNGSDPNAATTLKSIEDWLGKSLPSWYRAYVLDSAMFEISKKALLANGGGAVFNAGLILHPPKNLISENEMLGTKTHCPAYLAIGTYWDGSVALISLTEGSTAVFSAASGSLDPRGFHLIAGNMIGLTR